MRCHRFADRERQARWRREAEARRAAATQEMLLADVKHTHPTWKAFAANTHTSELLQNQLQLAQHDYAQRAAMQNVNPCTTGGLMNAGGPWTTPGQQNARRYWHIPITPPRNPGWERWLARTRGETVAINTVTALAALVSGALVYRLLEMIP